MKEVFVCKCSHLALRKVDGMLKNKHFIVSPLISVFCSLKTYSFSVFSCLREEKSDAFAAVIKTGFI